MEKNLRCTSPSYVAIWHFRRVVCIDKCLDPILVVCMGCILYYDDYFDYTLLIRFLCRFIKYLIMHFVNLYFGWLVEYMKVTLSFITFEK
jgi:hypothetical protein